MAGTDNMLLALSGIGHFDGKSFGFASCDRKVGAAEGINVLRHRKVTTTEPDGMRCVCVGVIAASMACASTRHVLRLVDVRDGSMLNPDPPISQPHRPTALFFTNDNPPPPRHAALGV